MEVGGWSILWRSTDLHSVCVCVCKYTIWDMIYRRPGFDCEILLIANCEFFYNSQSKESQEKEYAVTCDHAPFAQTRVFNHVQLSIVDEYSSIFVDISSQ